MRAWSPLARSTRAPGRGDVPGAIDPVPVQVQEDPAQEDPAQGEGTGIHLGEGLGAPARHHRPLAA
ncbi:hypothetical protein AN926_00700 [Thermus scotoductus]|uniref:Uncharacterized protein n=1 Tax=Thermus scotoductus TaxID=37636 RepID=A0A0N0IRV4_THESC|nr:hypothetical protein AN926_00700 [Thermus scotoductus]